MQLPDDSIGASDLLQWRECPAKFAYQMRRHTTLPDGRKDEPPESTNWTNAYGSCIHEAIHLVTVEGLTNDEAIERVWPRYAAFLDPEDLALLGEDLTALRRAAPLGWELVASEAEMRVPLFLHEGRQIYFRFRLDQLYRRADDSTAFLEKDWKSSKHRKTQADVDKDIKAWAYNFAIFEMFPECRSLIQDYDQLRFGTLKTGKNKEQRAQVKAWLIETAKAVLADERLEPKQNQWCPYCVLAPTCDVSKRASNYWKARLGALAPKTKEGRKTRIEFIGEAEDLEVMISETLPRIVETRKYFEAVERALKEIIGELPSEERERLGWRVSDRKTKVLTPDGLREVHRAMGDSFYEVVSLLRSAVEKVTDDEGELSLIRELELEQVSSTTVVPRG